MSSNERGHPRTLGPGEAGQARESGHCPILTLADPTLRCLNRSHMLTSAAHSSPNSVQWLLPSKGWPGYLATCQVTTATLNPMSMRFKRSVYLFSFLKLNLLNVFHGAFEDIQRWDDLSLWLDLVCYSVLNVNLSKLRIQPPFQICLNQVDLVDILGGGFLSWLLIYINGPHVHTHS